MSQNANPKPKFTDLSPETLQAFIETQKLKTLNEAREQEIRLKEMELNARLAEKSLEYQNEHLKRKPSENRKSLTRVCYLIAGLAGLFLIFILSLLYLGHEEFAQKFLSGLSYVVVSILSFLAGRKKRFASESKREDNSISENEIIHESN